MPKSALRQLRAISAIATQASLLKAAQVLGLSEPALIKALRETEDIVGVRLFDRHACGVEPSPHGALLVDAARRMLVISREAADALVRLKEQQDGVVVIGALPTAAACLMPAVIARLRREHPGIAVRVIEDRYQEQIGALMLGDIDLIVGRLYPPIHSERDLGRTELYDESLSVIVGCTHPLAAGGIISADGLERTRFGCRSRPFGSMPKRKPISHAMESPSAAATDSRVLGRKRPLRCTA